jgi:N-acetylglucosamine-6-phosphate deacetylase
MKIIDIHTHGIGGFDTRTTLRDDILHIAEIHGNYGVSEIIPTIYSSDTDTMRKHMQAVKEAMDYQQSENYKNKSARIIGIHLEGPFLNPSKCGALEVRSFLVPNEYNLRKLLDGFEDIVKIMTVAPELQGALRLIKDISDMGIIASMGHSDASYSEAEEGFRAGARGITHIFNAMRGIHHREPGIAAFGLMNRDIYIEIIADPFHLDEKVIELIFSVKKADRIIIISDSVKDTKTSPVTHVHGIRNEKNILLGGTMTVKESAERLIQKGLDKDTVMKAISDNPIRYLHLD